MVGKKYRTAGSAGGAIQIRIPDILHAAGLYPEGMDVE
jgi:hypothetical protein